MLYCIYVFVYETREFSLSGAICQKFLFSRHLCLVCLPQFNLRFVLLRLVNSKKMNFVFIILECKIHGVSQETRPVTCVLGLEGIALG
jgi:hypothetical protein